MKQHSGFTLIELIIVIVILGILAVTAAPKFIDIQGDAVGSTLQGVKAAVHGSAQLVYAKSAIAGKQKTAYTGASTPTVSINGKFVDINYGYPHAGTMTNDKLAEWVDISSSDFTVELGAGTADASSPALGSFAITPASGATTIDYTENTEDGASCHVLYTNAGGPFAPAVVSIVKGGC